MAETLLSFGIEKVWDLLVRESDRIKGVDEQLTELISDLEFLRSFLKDADAKKHANETVKSCVEQIKEIAFDTEDVIETFLLKEELAKTSGLKQRMRRLSCIIVDRRKVALDMEGISQRISKVITRMTSLGVQQMSVNGREDVQRLEEKQREIRKTFPTNNEKYLVGLEENVMKIVGYLVEDDNIQVVSIIGMGGIGKTTLARQVFNHEKVTNHFDGIVWVCLSQQFTRTYVWEAIFKKLSPKNDEQRDSNMTEDELQEKLFRLLETSNSLIVLDDIWKEEDWDLIKDVFPPNKGYKILLTSRYERVALHIDPKDELSVIFKPECLKIEDSWTLFQMTAFPRKDTSEYKVDEEMEEMGRQMVKHCGGLPLAISLLGGLLAPQYTLSDWTRVYENIKSHIVRGNSFNEKNMSSVYHILRLSFEELPIYLKYCFLYLAHFPEDYTIELENLAYYWAAEGIPRPRNYDGQTIREVGNRYIKELVNRNMVISERDIETSRFETCHLHDMMREVCLLQAEEENFQQIVHSTSTTNSRSLCKSRRLVVDLSDKEYIQVEEMKNPKLRSLLFIRKHPEELRMWKTSDLSFPKLKLLRILNLSLAEFERKELPSSIGKLIHLRYLNLYFARVQLLPSSMQNLKKLLYLNLDVCAFDVYMPDILNGMRELAYLTLPEDTHGLVNIELGNLVSLETLKNFSTKNNNVKDLHTMTRLRVLSINIHRGGCTLESLSSSLKGIRTLEKLEIEDDKVLEPMYDDDKFVLDCVHLKQLKLKVHMPKLPDEQHFPSHLTTIYLLGCLLKEDPMPILGKLHQLKKVTLWYKSFIGRRMVCSAGGFRQLEELTLFGQEELEEWIVEEGSMPLLHTLTVSNCPKLKHEADVFLNLQKLLQLKDVVIRKVTSCGSRMVCSSGEFPQLHMLCLRELYELEEWIIEEGSMPLLHTLYIKDCPKLKLSDGLRFITSLKRLYIDIDNLDMEKEWKEKLSEGGEDYYKVQHIPSVELTKSWKWQD